MRESRTHSIGMPIQPQEVVTEDFDVADPRQGVKCALFADAVRQFGKAKIKAWGSSMSPAIQPGDVLTIEHCEMNEVAEGDVAGFLRDGRIFVHRVVGVESKTGYFTTRGDALDCCDLPVRREEFLGRVTHVQRPFNPAAKARKFLGAVKRAALAFSHR